MQVEVEIQKLDGLIFKTNYEQRMSSGVRAGDNDVILIGRSYERFYTPEIVRIGLNHDYDSWRGTMYEDKCWCLKSLLDRINEKSVDRYVRAMDDLVERARACYVQPADASQGESVEMMLLDSCFILELFRTFQMLGSEDMNGPIIHKSITDSTFLPALRRDLFRVGNQLPFSVLLKILEISSGITLTPYNLIHWAVVFFETISSPYDLVSKYLIGGEQLPQEAEIHSLLELVYYVFVPRRSLYCHEKRKLVFINYATKLEEAGVKFKKIKSAKNLFDIKFKKGVLEIPPLRVSDDMLYDLRTLMEFEKQLPPSVLRPINDYVKFIQCLVNSPNDVKLLRRCGIIDDWHGNDEVSFNMLNDLGSNAEISAEFPYSELLKYVIEYCRHRRLARTAELHVWMAELRRNYFSSPWTFLSLLAAIVLLLLTVTQTIYSILSYHHN